MANKNDSGVPSFLSFCCQLGSSEAAHSENVDIDEMENDAQGPDSEKTLLARKSISNIAIQNTEKYDALVHRGRNFRALLTRGLQVMQIVPAAGETQDLSKAVRLPKVLWLDAGTGVLLYCTTAKNVKQDSLDDSASDGSAVNICIRVDDILDVEVVGEEKIIRLLHLTSPLALQLGSMASCLSFKERFMEFRDYRSRQTENEQFKTVPVEFRKQTRTDSFRIANESAIDGGDKATLSRSNTVATLSSDDKDAQKNKLGFKIVSKDKKMWDGQEGRWHRVLMTHVAEESQAAAQGVRVGDIILSVNGKEVYTSAQAFGLIKESIGESGFVSMSIGRMKDGNMPLEHAIMAAEEKRGKFRYQIKLEKGTIGWAIGPSSLTATASSGGADIIVKSVCNGSQAAKFGVQVGDQIETINGEKTASLDKLITAIKASFETSGASVVGLSTMHGPSAEAVKKGMVAERIVIRLGHAGDKVGWEIEQVDGPDGSRLVTVNTVVAESQAAKAGVLVGDRLLAVNEELVDTVSRIENAFKSAKNVEITIERKLAN